MPADRQQMLKHPHPPAERSRCLNAGGYLLKFQSLRLLLMFASVTKQPSAVNNRDVEQPCDAPSQTV